jgi:hypothetical protein
MQKSGDVQGHGYSMKSSDKADACPNQTTTPVAHASGSALGPVALHTPKGILDVFRLEWGSGLRRLDEERAHRERNLGVVRGIFTTTFVAGIQPQIRLAFSQEGRRAVVLPKVGLLQRLFDVQRCDRKRADHLECEEADNVGGIVVGFEIEMCGQVQEFPEALGCEEDRSIY